MRFTHRTGERPLAGYTIKRGVGQGGFGEVYFAVSDAGKEVALKLLRGSSDVELRGVANCLNLKHPNLVHVYDLRTDDRGGQWLIMEYVLGESLAQMLDRQPNGLPVEVAVEWFRALAKAVNYLHDHGVVHRDLKPANIFLEHGNLKVGDYGLCKAMSTSGRPQTRAVGTVHYMAPEISGGQYTKSIDVYACGVILYEMLTGRPPFEGETDAEVLMKHLTADPDLTRLPEAFKPIIARALEKKPTSRFDSLNDMVRAVEAAASGERKLPDSPLFQQPPPLPTAPRVPEPPIVVAAKLPVAKPTTLPVIPLRDRLLDLSGSMAKAPLVVALGVIPWAAATGNLDSTVSLGKSFLLALAVTWGVLLTVGDSAFKAKDTWGRRLRQIACGLLIGAFAFWLDGFPGPDFNSAAEEVSHAEPYAFGSLRMSPLAVSVLGHYLLYFAATMGLMRWWRVAARDRKESFSLVPPLAAAFWGVVLAFLWPWATNNLHFGVVPLVLAAIAVQWVSPWSPPPPPQPKRLKWKG
ncbi:hypothetical protein BH11PLA2_BH11PLA2_06430 [soil metagenome]